MEPISTSIIAIKLWEYLGEPLVDKIKDKYSEKIIDETLSLIKIENDEQNIIKNEIKQCDNKTLTNKENFLNFINNNKNIQKLLSEKPIIIRSLTNIEDSEVNLKEKSSYIQDSLNNIKNSKINIG